MTAHLRPDDQAVLRSLKEAGSDLSRPHPVNHYLYFPKEDSAHRAAQELRAEGYDIQLRLGADGVNWLVLASRVVVPEPEVVEQIVSRMESLAAAFEGEYDGWEAEAVR